MAIKYYTMTEIRAMSDEELIKLSAERNSRNKLSSNAEKAMKVRKNARGVLFGMEYQEKPRLFKSRRSDLRVHGISLRNLID